MMDNATQFRRAVAAYRDKYGVETNLPSLDEQYKRWLELYDKTPEELAAQLVNLGEKIKSFKLRLHGRKK